VHVYDKLNHVFDWYAFRGTSGKKGTASFVSFTDDVCFVLYHRIVLCLEMHGQMYPILLPILLTLIGSHRTC
jgi:hypothetical protein